MTVLDGHLPTGQSLDELWRAAASQDATTAGDAGSLVRDLLHWYGAPRDPGLLKRFCSDLPNGRVMLYGAGTLTRSLLEHLPPGIVVVGVLDRMAFDIGTFHGYPVYQPAQTAGLAFDWVLLAHSVYEMEMRAAAVAAGIPPDRIITVHTNPRYRELSAPMVEMLADQASQRPVKAMIVSCCSTNILHDRQLAEWLRPEATIQLFLGREVGGVKNEGPYLSFDLRESLAALVLVLQRQRPRVVYVRSIIYKNYLGMLIKHVLPEATVIQEFYDYTVLWPDNDLVNLFGLNATSIAWLRQSELIAGQTLDLTLSKRGGAEWDRVQARLRAPYRLVFPQMVEGPEPSNGAPLADLVYAGFLPSSTFLRSFPIGYNFLPLIETLCRDGGLTADIFNSSHADTSGDAIFADYLERYAAPPMIYSRRLDYADLLTRLSSYRFGWLCNDQKTFHSDRRVGVCNRWTGYVSAGLPTLLDASWGFMGELLREYGAGLVIERLEPDAVLQAIRNADHAALVDGTLRLRSKLLVENRAATDDIAALIEQGMASPGQFDPQSQKAI
ncbi:hypothetical protein JHL17_25525 [Azospirillum sp. YIM B02556]|uniref:Uncharacterized protein n=1 Tax=Azospirillum endophyticum TaxID=2800326 RepID=A0ABS1FBJ1_9PROT|nr:hypothetical protein [Azospirillum endophyticum]MBK1840769.1 hypothetical protein [Azospirillum endophyticum]